MRFQNLRLKYTKILLGYESILSNGQYTVLHLQRRLYELFWSHCNCLQNNAIDLLVSDTYRISVV